MPRTKARSSERPCWRSWTLLVALLVVLFVSPAPTEAEPDPGPGSRSASSVLDAPTLQSLREKLLALDRERLAHRLSADSGSAARCRLTDRRWSCRRLHMRLDRWEFEAAKWVRKGEKTVVEELGVRDRRTGRLVFADRVAASGSEVRVEGFRTALPGGPGLGSRRVVLESSAMAFDEPRWMSFERRSRDTSWRLISRLEPRGAPDLRARRATHRRGTWRFEGLRTTRPFALPLGPRAGDAPRPASGLLPPRFTYSLRTLEARQQAVHGSTGLGLSLAAAPGGWYGLGPILVRPTAAGWPRIRADRPALLDTDVLYDTDAGSLEGAAVGETRFGDPYLHVSGSVEEMSRDRYWRTRRVGRSGFLRPWRRSALGAAFSGTSHHFQIRGAHWSPSAVGPPRTAGRAERSLEGEEAELQLRFGTETRIGEAVEFSTDVFHRNAAREEAPDDHGTALVASTSATVGRTGRLFGEVHAASLVGASFTSPSPAGGTTSGFQAVPVTQILGGLRGGLTLRGDFAALTHRFRPSIVFYRELAGRGVHPGAESPYLAPFARVPQWTMAAALMEHSLRWQRLELRAPSGLLFEGSGFSRALSTSPTLFQRLALDWPATSVETGVAAPTDLRTAGGFARFEYEFRRWLGSLGATTLKPGALAVLDADAILPHPAATLRLIQGESAFDSDEGSPWRALVPFASLDWDDGTNRFETAAFGANPSRRAGLSGGWTHRFSRTGWGLGFDGVVTLPDGRWGLAIGLRRSRD